MGKKSRREALRQYDNKSNTDLYEAYRTPPTQNKIDFATGWNIKENKDHQVQAESSQGHSPSDIHLHSETPTSSERQRDESTHPESELPNASEHKVQGKMWQSDQKTHDEMKKFHHERDEATEQDAVIDGKQARGSSNEIVLASQVDSPAFREKLLRQDSSVPDSSIDQPHLVERVQELEKDARTKKELFFNTLEKCKSINNEITRLKKERAALKKDFKPQATEMKKLKSKIEKLEQKREELTLQLNKIKDDYIIKTIEIVHKSDQGEFLHESIKKEHENKESILKYLEYEIKKRQMQKEHFKSKLDQISKSQENIERFKEHEIRQKNILDNERWIEQLKKTESELEEEKKCKIELKEILEKSIKKYSELGIQDINPNKLPTHMRSDTLPAKLSLVRKYMSKQFGELKITKKLEEEIIEIAENEIMQVKNQINHLESNNKRLNEMNSYDKIIDKEIAFTDENNSNFYQKIDSNGLSYSKDRLEIIDYYNRNIPKKVKNNIEDFESRYEKLQNSMCHFDELKEDHRIAEQYISQYHFDHTLYLEERQRIIKQYRLANQPFKEEIPIQNSELSQEEYIDVLKAKIEELNKTCETQDRKIKIQKNLIDLTIPSKIEKYLSNIGIISSTSDLLRNSIKDPFSTVDAKNYLEDLDNKKRKIQKDLKYDAQELLNNRDKIVMCMWEILKINKSRRDCLLKEIEDYQLEKSNLEKGIDAKLKNIESQINTDLRNLQRVYNGKKSELRSLRSDLEDLDKKMQPDIQQQYLRNQFNKQINKIQLQLDASNKELEVDHKILEDTKNEFSNYDQKREPLTRQIKDRQDKLKDEKKKLDLANAEWLKSRVVAEKARSSLESSIIERTRNSMERRNGRKVSGEIRPISDGLQGDTKNRTSEHLGEIANMENDYGIINIYNERIKMQHAELDKLNQVFTKLYEQQNLLKRYIIQNKIKIGSIYKYRDKLENKSLEQLAILNNKREEYTAMNQVFSKLDEEYHDCLKKCEAMGNVIAILNNEISVEEEGQKKLTSQSDEINTKPEQLNALDSQSHTIRPQSEVSTQEVKDLLEKELAAAEQKKRELEEKVENSRKKLGDKNKQLKIAGDEWKEKHRNYSKSRQRIVKALAEKYELRHHLAKVKKDIEAIEISKFHNQVESYTIIRKAKELLENDNPTVSDIGQEEIHNPSNSKSILSELASGVGSTVIEWRNANWHEQFNAQAEKKIKTDNKDKIRMIEAKMAAMQSREWRAQWPKRPWDEAAGD